MKFKRFFALALAALLVMSLFAGCSKNSDTPGSKTDSSGSLIDQTKPAATTAKYAYQADYLDLQLPENIQYVNTMCTAGTTIFLTAYVQGDEIVQTDPDTGDTWSYYTQELILLSVDPDTGACTQLPNLQLPTVPEDCEGNVDCYNMAGSDDGTLWMLVNVYAAKYDLPADFDPNTMNKYDYPSTDMSTAYLMHVAADGSTIANVDLSVTDDGTDEEDGMGSNISSFAVDAAGNLYVTDYNYIYVLDAEGKLLFKIDDSQYSGSLCRLQPDQVGILWYNYATDTAESTDENGPVLHPRRILIRRPGARRPRCRPTSGTSIRATTPTISITRTTTTSMATPSRAIRRTSSSTGWPAMSTPATCMTPGCSPTAASSA